MEISEDLLTMLKQSLGDLNPDSGLDKYYKNKLRQAIADLETEDISEDVLNTSLGQTAIIHLTYLLINNLDIATNPTLNLLKNKLSAITKGEKYD